MKKIAFVILMVAILLAGCGPSKDECDNAWQQLDAPYGEETFYVNLVLNSEWAPDSVGFVIKECIQSGWEGYR